MSDMKAQLEGLRHDWSVCKAQDDQKHSLITSLFNHVDAQSDLLLDANAELRDKKDAIKVTGEHVEELEERLRELQLEKDRHAFVLVIIDGDCMPFRDDLVRDGLEGGKRTASIFKQAVEGELKSFSPVMPHHLQVIVRVYANLKGLAKTYKDTGILPAPDSLEAFVSGFNMGDTLCDYVDAGNGKECADEKVKASFQHHLADIHCRQIFFGASADSAYARLLGKYLQDEVVRRRICLIEGPPWAQELADFKDKFHTVLFDTVFRSQKLPNIKRRVSFHTTPPTSPSVNYANAASRAPSTPAPVPPAHQVSVLSRGLVSVGILRNSQGQRVDSQLTYSSQDFNDLKSRKLCNHYHLLGTCPYQGMHGNCQHDHDKILSQAQKAAMRAIARLSPCANGLMCSNRDCIYGHRCAWENCSSPGCRFPREMHNVDTRVISE